MNFLRLGKKVIILEAKDRVGGRIFPLRENDFGYTAQGGAEFVHGEAPIINALIKAAGLNFISMDGGEVWTVRRGEMTKSMGGPTNDPIYLEHKNLIIEKLKELTADLPISEFMERYFNEEKYLPLQAWITDMVEGYDAADPQKIAPFLYEMNGLSGEEWQQGRIKEGYGCPY